MAVDQLWLQWGSIRA